MTEVTIRSYRPSDRAAVLEALTALQDREAELHDSRLPGAPTSEPYLEHLLEERATASGAILVAELGGAIVGIAACAVVDDPSVLQTADSMRYGEVSDVYVAPPHRRRGIARALLEAAERHLAAGAVTRVRISFLAGNDEARQTYARAGYEPYEVVLEKRTR